MSNQADARRITEGDASSPWVGSTPGLRTKFFAVKCKDGEKFEHIYNCYIFTSKKAMDDYLAGPLYKQRVLENKMKTQEMCRTMELLQGTEHTAELGQWPDAYHLRPNYYKHVTVEYFQLYARAESIRLLLAYVGQPFKNRFMD